MEDETRITIRKREIRRSSPSSPIKDPPLSDEEPATTAGNNPVKPAAAMSKEAFIQIIGVTSVRLISWPMVSVPNMKANDAEPRIQPYSNSRSAHCGLAAFTDNASARDVVGARQAAWITVMKSSNEKECAQNNAAADTAANAVQSARARRNEPARSANIPTNGPAARRINIPAASIKPICWGLSALISKNLGQNGDATPNAAYKAA
jgi:hypothetical protein